jgi:TRAP transporter 4TM/12TM fusion protein
MNEQVIEEIKKVELTRYDHLPKWLKVAFLIFSGVGLLLAIICVFGLSYKGLMFSSEAYYYLLIALFSSGVFLVLPAHKKQKGIPWYDILFAALTFAIAFYFFIYSWEIGNVGWIPPTRFQFICALILSLLILEGGRRAAGMIYTVVGIFFAFYPVFAGHMPGILYGNQLSFVDTVASHAFGSEGMIGLPSKIMGDILIGFLLFAGVLLASGAGKTFIDLALALFGGFRGGPAKVAVVSSCLFGSISGSPISNVIGTGSVTIPMMKRLGFSPHFAGAVEACASTGGILMPPMMGAVAFVVAAFLGIEYREVAIAAAVPAILFYATLLLQVDCYSARMGLRGLPRNELPSIVETLKRGWQFMAVLVFLIWGLFYMKWEMYTPYYASLLMFLLSFFRRELWMTPRKIVATLASVGQLIAQTMAVLIPVAFIVSGLTITGTSAAFTSGIVGLGGGNVVVILILGIVACYILGMAGLMISAYVFLSVTFAPALIQLGGFNTLAVHLFILYWVMLSCITPPVAVSAFVAAAIAGTSPMKVALQSCRLAAVIYFIPVFFVYNPSLILVGTWIECLYTFVLALIGVAIIAVGMEGYCWGAGKILWLPRILLVVGGFLIVLPEVYTDIIGAIISAVAFAAVFGKARSDRKAGVAGTSA